MENSWQNTEGNETWLFKILYNQRNKDETIVSVIKRLFGEHISSRLIRMQNRELTFRCITYNLHRMLNLIIIKWILLSPSYHHHLLFYHYNKENLTIIQLKNASNYIDNNISNCSLIITNYKMLQMTGIDFIKQIKEKYSNSINNFKTKFMLVTAFTKSNFDRHNALNYINIDKIIEKPIRLEIFKEVQKLRAAF